ncbi:sigma-E factor negative regulatory protein RseB [Methylomarinovum tepidoasis]|uniref:Sigma-E factor negative regulatory protein RseB n=1 Tax=Methylomarinovum tepidoasis TaxID=2840183 RepID=A0AAU9CFY3_9GAMM|nr:MucB/RseB C-terminal domain-containing protein [Methylomarinovum sp. IN45]BCX89138.1 sigma-E factor negative regulatory protein RseB [Methylomarinovum sp. IN45]
MPKTRFCALLWLLCHGLIALAAELKSPQDWLQAMNEAMRHLDYQATVVYSRDNRIQTLRLVHLLEDGVVRERLQALDGAPRTVVRESDQIRCYFPDRKMVTVGFRHGDHPLFDNTLPSRWDELARYYRLRLGAQTQVAGRPAREIVIEPLDAHRYGRRLWIDTETRLPLRFELVDRDGEVLESFVVTDLKVGEAVALPQEGEDHQGWKVLDRKEIPADIRWRLTYLPPGFKEVRRSRHIDPETGAAIDHLLLSDGLATVSVYIRQADGERADAHRQRLGAVNVYSRRLGDHWITVLGDVPPDTAARIGEGVRGAAP